MHMCKFPNTIVEGVYDIFAIIECLNTMLCVLSNMMLHAIDHVFSYER